MSTYSYQPPKKLEKIFQLAYSSIAVPDLDTESLESIMLSAINHNATRQITGSLIFQDGIFFQVLEGDEREVLELVEKIKKDDRHKEFQIAWTTEVENRRFDMWSMRYVDYERLNQKEQEYLKNISRTMSNQEPNVEVLKILAAAR